MFDIDTYTAIKAEEKAYEQWERQEKNFIINMVDPQRKQEKWVRLFGHKEICSDDYLSGGIY